MKKMIALFLLAFSTVSFAKDLNYKCIADRLQAYNSDIFYNLQPSEIDELLNPNCGDARHSTVVWMADYCAKNEPVSKKSMTEVFCNGNLEAQFIGQMTNVSLYDAEAGSVEHVEYGIGNFSHFNVNPLCPLDDQLALKASFWIQGRPSYIKEGAAISGVLVYNPKTGMFHIE